MSKVNRYENYKIEVVDRKLIVTINIDESQVEVAPSSSEKTMIVATTGGAVNVPNTALKLSLNLYRKP
jgi:hypothetical protein